MSGSCGEPPKKRPRDFPRLHGLLVRATFALPISSCALIIAEGSVIDYTGSAIVNAANTGCIGGGGVDGAVNRAGGPELRAAREALPIVESPGTRCHTGDATITIGGDLSSKYVIHAVGPAYGSDDEPDELLFKAYRSAMLQAKANGLPDLAFSLISAGIFRGDRSLRHVLTIAFLAIRSCSFHGLKQVFLVGFMQQELATLQDIGEELLGEHAQTEANVERAIATLEPGLQDLIREMGAEMEAEVALEARSSIGVAIAETAAVSQQATG